MYGKCLFLLLSVMFCLALYFLSCSEVFLFPLRLLLGLGLGSGYFMFDCFYIWHEHTMTILYMWLIFHDVMSYNSMTDFYSLG